LDREEAYKIYHELRDSLLSVVKPGESSKNQKKVTQKNSPQNEEYIENSIQEDHDVATPLNISFWKTDYFSNLLLYVLGAVALSKGLLSVLAFTGTLTIYPVQATVNSSPSFQDLNDKRKSFLDSVPSDEKDIYLLLDKRRSEIEKRLQRLVDKEEEFEKKEQSLKATLLELRELTQKLKNQRSQGDQKKKAQIDNLAQVYVSMSPEESAKLLDQLDTDIALEIIQRMPQKRVGQLLSLMKPGKALGITKFLSGEH
jgi:flagellar motility protein MotE (MotC chaperone)